MKRENFKKFFIGLVSIIIGFIFGLGVSVFAWVNPSQNPPLGGGVLQTDTSGLKIVTTTQITTGNFTVNTGNVGIGTTAPGSKLHIVGASGVGRSVMIHDREIKFRGDGVAHFSIYGPDTGKSYLTIQNTSANAAPGTVGTDLLTITSGGNVGIGTTAPSSKLDISSSMGGTGVYARGLNVVSELNNNSNRLYGGFFVIDTKNYTTTDALENAAVAARAFFSGGTGITQNDLTGVRGIVYFKGSGGTLNNAYSIYAAAPSNYGTVSGSLLNAYSLFVESPSIGVNNNFAIYQSGSAKNYFAGNVGIGTTAPDYKLDIAGALRLQPSSAPTGANGVIYYDSTANKFKCYEGGAWKDCISAGGGGELFVSASVPPQIINQGSYIVLARITVPTTKPNLKVIAVAVSPFYTFGAQGNARIELFNETDNLSVATWGSGAGPVYVEPNQVFDLGGKTVSLRLSHGAPAPQECWGSVSLKLMP
jgi:hypothetical protein